jgi:hypothetical protein
VIRLNEILGVEQTEAGMHLSQRFDGVDSSATFFDYRFDILGGYGFGTDLVGYRPVPTALVPERWGGNCQHHQLRPVPDRRIGHEVADRQERERGQQDDKRVSGPGAFSGLHAFMLSPHPGGGNGSASQFAIELCQEPAERGAPCDRLWKHSKDRPECCIDLCVDPFDLLRNSFGVRQLEMDGRTENVFDLIRVVQRMEKGSTGGVQGSKGGVGGRGVRDLAGGLVCVPCEPA